jgi:hypothetical protein
MNKPAKALVLTSAILCATLFGSPARAQDNAWATGGLQKVTIPGLDLAYVKPGATLKQYTKVAMKPVSISFAKNWAEDVTAGTIARVQPADMTAIRTKLAHMLEMAVYTELKAGGYNLVSAVGEDVLYVEMDLENLYISAPQLPTGMTLRDTYALTAGQAQLIVQLSDTVTGDTIARVVDNYHGMETGQQMMITAAVNQVEAQNACTQWAKRLRMALDKSKGINTK